MELPIKTKSPNTFANSVTKDDIEQILDYISEMLITTYVCGQFGFYFSLNDEQSNIYKVHGKTLGDKLGFKISDNVNDKAFVWTRLNANNYNWGYKVWSNLIKKYYGLFEKQHDSIKLNNYLMVNKIFPNDK